MTKIDTSTDAVELLLKDVTPGPWECNAHTQVGPVSQEDDQTYGMICDAVCELDYYNNWETNARFIAAARELVPALLQRAIAAEAERDALRAENELLKAQLAIQEYTIAKKAMNTIWNEALEQAATVQVRNGFDDRVMYELHPMLAAAIRALRQLEE